MVLTLPPHVTTAHGLQPAPRMSDAYTIRDAVKKMKTVQVILEPDRAQGPGDLALNGEGESRTPTPRGT